jgi:hypothetical protein
MRDARFLLILRATRVYVFHGRGNKQAQSIEDIIGVACSCVIEVVIKWCLYVFHLFSVLHLLNSVLIQRFCERWKLAL